MKPTIILGLVALVAPAFSTPLPNDKESKLMPRQNTGSYTVSGLGSRKKQVTSAGGSTLDLAIAMLETFVSFSMTLSITNITI